MIIGIAGPTASGKTTVATMLEQECDAYRIRYSNILAEIARARGLDPEDKATLQGIYLTERQTRGEDFLAKELEHRVLTVENPFIVIEGNRRCVDVEVLRDIARRKREPLLLLFIDASVERRFARYNERLVEHGEKPISLAAFIELESNDAEDEIGALREIFTREGTVINTDNTSREAVFTQVQELIAEA